MTSPYKFALSSLDQSDSTHPTPKLLTKVLDDIEYVVQHGPPFSLKDLPAYVDAIKNANGVGIDDRKMLLEKILVLMSRLPLDSKFSATLQQFVIDLFYKDLPHPPSSLLALSPAVAPALPRNPLKYAYRTADGSDYSYLFPSMGRAGTPYARSVPSLSTNSTPHLPDAGLVFDTLLRRDEFVPHPGGISSLFFAFADLIIHSVFNTNHQNWTINDVSSYLDLSILYGSSAEQVDSVRRKNGYGKLWDDVFADGRLLFMPPSVGALLVLFNRNHNYIAERILAINENRTYTNPPPQDPVALKAQDDEIFNRARLVNCGFFVQGILRDYVGSILGLVRDGFSWRLDPLQFDRELDHEVSPRGKGNTVSIEFNLLYRWHAAISSHDTQWTENLFKKLFNGKDFDEVNIEDFQRAAREYMIPDPDVKKWTFGDLARDSNGRFSDAALASIIQEATESSASAFKARGIPSVLRVIEVMGIEQARSWGTCTLNEFRKFMGLKPYDSFAEWNPDPEIHSAASVLYQHIDNLELHVGLQAEETKPPIPGAGLCPGYTISRAILSDAVCLIRSDRFLTVDFTPFNLTTWGYQDCQADINDGSFGGILSKLLFRHLPEFYPVQSAYAHFPFMVPEKMKEYMARQPDARVDSYTWTRPERSGVPSLNDRALRIAGASTTDIKQILFSPESIENSSKSFEKITTRLIEENSTAIAGVKYLDVVKDVVNLVPVHWVAYELIGLLPTTSEKPSDLSQERHLYDKFANAAEYLYVNTEASDDWRLCKESVEAFNIVRDAIASSLEDTSGCFSLLQRRSEKTVLRELALSTGASAEALASSIFTEIVTTTAIYSKAVVQIIEQMLGEETFKRTDKGLPEFDIQIISRARKGLLDEGHLSPNDNHGMMTPEFFDKTAVAILGVLFSLPGVRKAPGQSTRLGCFSNHTSGVSKDAYIDTHGRITPWPISMLLQYK